MKILITGAAGFIGSHLAEALIAQGNRVVGIDNFMDYYPRRFKEKNLEGLRSQAAFEFIEADLLDTDLVALVKPLDAVIHLAASSLVGESMEDPGKYFENNLVGGVNLLEESAAAGAKRFVLSSTAATYGEPK